MLGVIKKYLIVLLVLVFCVGCWDQKLLKDIGIVSVIGLDVNKKNDVLLTIALPISSKGQNIQEQSVVIPTKGVTTKNAKEHLGNKVSETLDTSKSRVLLLGEQLAKKHGIFSVMDNYYRDSTGPIDANVAIVKGSVKDILSILPKEKPLLSEFFYGLLKSSDESGLIINENAQTTFAKMSTEGKDVLIPYIKLLKEENRVKIVGLAMFHKDKQTGNLSPKESRVFLVLNGNQRKKTSLTLKVHKNEKTKNRNYININILDLKRKLIIKEKAGQLKAEILINMKVGVDEYPKNHLKNKKRLQKLNKEISHDLTKTSEQIISKMQKANCDGLGIGLRVKAFHHKTWNKIKWEKEYSHIPIKVAIKTEIIEHGVID